MQEKLSSPKTGRPKLFYGWIVVVGCALMMGTSIGLFVNCNGIFIKPVCEDLGFTRGAFTLYASIASFVGMFMQVVYGNLYQKYPMLPFSRVSIFVVCSCVLGYSFATKLWHFYALAILYGLSSTPVLTVTIASLVSNWFVDKKGLAMGLAYSGSGVTAAIMTPILSSVVQNVGWRWGYRLLAVSGFAVLFVSVFVLLREKPSDMGLSPLNNHAADSLENVKLLEPVGLSKKQALKSPEFYMTAFGIAIFGGTTMGTNPHVISYLTDTGYSAATASTVSSIIMVVMIFAKIALGAVFDRIGAALSAILSGCCMAASLVSLMLCRGSAFMPFVFAVCFGFGYSIGTVPASFLVIENFGAKEFSAIYSISSMLSGIFSSFGPSITGALYDVSGSYMIVWPIYLGLICLAMLSLSLASTWALRKNYNPRAVRPHFGKN